MPAEASTSELAAAVRATALAAAALLGGLAACSEAPAPPAADPPAGTETASPGPAEVPYKDDEDDPAEEPVEIGRYRLARTPGPSTITEEQRERIAELQTIGYAAGVVDAPEFENVVTYDPNRAWNGLNLYTSGHASEAVLMDMGGAVLHRWHHDLEETWPGIEAGGNRLNCWRRVHLLPHGELLAIHEGIGISKLDAGSNLVWKARIGAHHDLEVLPDGSIWVLTRTSRMIPRLHPDRPCNEEFLVLLDPDGRERRRISLLEALERSEWACELVDMGHGDIFHTNTLELLGDQLVERDPVFASGRFLVSLLFAEALGVVDPETETFVWWKRGPETPAGWKRQHQPVALEDGNLLLFDNQGGANGKNSRVLEVDPVALNVRWMYASGTDTRFFSYDCGSSARLPNGNTLVTESNNGRAFEITDDGTVVWDFYNPHRAGDDGRFIASLFEMIRLPPETPLDWAHPD